MVHRGLLGCAFPGPGPFLSPVPSPLSWTQTLTPALPSIPGLRRAARPRQPLPPPLLTHFPARYANPSSKHSGKELTVAVLPPTAATPRACRCQATVVSVLEVRGHGPLAQSLLGLVVPAESGAEPPSGSLPTRLPLLAGLWGQRPVPGVSARSPRPAPRRPPRKQPSKRRTPRSHGLSSDRETARGPGEDSRGAGTPRGVVVRWPRSRL